MISSQRRGFRFRPNPSVSHASQERRRRFCFVAENSAGGCRFGQPETRGVRRWLGLRGWASLDVLLPYAPAATNYVVVSEWSASRRGRGARRSPSRLLCCQHMFARPKKRHQEEQRDG